MLNLTTLCDPERIKGNSLWVYWPALNNHNEEVDMKKLAAVGIILSTLSGSVWAHEAGEFFIRAGSATVRTRL